MALAKHAGLVHSVATCRSIRRSALAGRLADSQGAASTGKACQKPFGAIAVCTEDMHRGGKYLLGGSSGQVRIRPCRSLWPAASNESVSDHSERVLAFGVFRHAPIVPPRVFQFLGRNVVQFWLSSLPYGARQCVLIFGRRFNFDQSDKYLIPSKPEVALVQRRTASAHAKLPTRRVI